MPHTLQDQQLLERCLMAFGEAAVYFGGPHQLNRKGRDRSVRFVWRFFNLSGFHLREYLFQLLSFFI